MHTALAPRRSSRRSVHLETEVRSEHWDGPVALLATELSPDGLWVESDYALEVGSELSVAFVPPHWPYAAPLSARARVTRVGRSRRAGMGLCFRELRSDVREGLRRALHECHCALPLTAAMSRILGVHACASVSSASSFR
ncbi:MAG TPA: hypothetical protein VJR89_00765 [Polyangiales bacterium]|nr:hypothetical protein [Polyangiales bacterium]